MEEDFQFLEIFENSIGAVVRIGSSCFVKHCLLMNKADSEAACYDRFMKMLATSDGLDVDLSDITEESKQLREIKDIRDELHMISMVFKQQIEVFNDQASEWEKRGITKFTPARVNQYLSKVHAMQDQAETTYESVRVSTPH